MSVTPPVDIVDRHPLVIEISADECDACPSAAHVQAYVYAEFTTGSVALCGHHATVGWDNLNRQALRVIDLRHLIGT